MKKKQKKSKSEVEVVSDEATNCEFNRQPYGYCMNTKSKHYSNSCHKCNAFKEKCDAEGEVEVEQRKVISRCDGMRDDGTCGNGYCDNHNKKCRGAKCPERLTYDQGKAVTVVEPRGGAVGMTDQDVAAGITRQLQVIEDAEKNAQLERVKLGVVLIRWEQFIGESRGRGKAGEGLKGWLEKNVPELGYKAAISYKTQAEMALKMLGGGAKAQAVILDEPTVTQPDGEVIEVEADYVAKRDKIFEDVKSRRQLEQTYFKFMASEGAGGGARRGRPKGTTADLTKKPDTTDKVAAARAAWSKVIVQANTTMMVLQSAVRLLSAEDVENAKIVLQSLMDLLNEREGELKM